MRGEEHREIQGERRKRKRLHLPTHPQATPTATCPSSTKTLLASIPSSSPPPPLPKKEEGRWVGRWRVGRPLSKSLCTCAVWTLERRRGVMRLKANER